MQYCQIQGYNYNKILYKKILQKELWKSANFLNAKKVQRLQTFRNDAFSDPERRLYSTKKNDMRHDTWKNSVKYDRFFYAESDASNEFCPSHLDFMGFPDLQLVAYDMGVAYRMLMDELIVLYT